MYTIYNKYTDTLKNYINIVHNINIININVIKII